VRNTASKLGGGAEKEKGQKVALKKKNEGENRKGRQKREIGALLKRAKPGRGVCV